MYVCAHALPGNKPVLSTSANMLCAQRTIHLHTMQSYETTICAIVHKPNTWDKTMSKPDLPNDSLAILGSDYHTKALALREVADNAELNNRTERQRLVDTILTFANSDDVDSSNNPSLLIDKVDRKFLPHTAKALAKKVYNIPGELKVERRYEKAIRDVANIVMFAIEKRIALKFDEDADALMVPNVLVTTSKDIRKDLLTGKFSYEDALSTPALSALVPLDGENSKNLATLRKNIPNYLKKPSDVPEGEESEDTLTLALHKVGTVLQKLPVGYKPEPEALEMAEEILTQIKALSKPVKKAKVK